MKIQMASSGTGAATGGVQSRTGPRVGTRPAGGRGGRGQRGRGGRGGRGGAQKKDVTAEELDAELDQYISKVRLALRFAPTLTLAVSFAGVRP